MCTSWPSQMQSESGYHRWGSLAKGRGKTFDTQSSTLLRSFVEPHPKFMMNEKNHSVVIWIKFIFKITAVLFGQEGRCGGEWEKGEIFKIKTNKFLPSNFRCEPRRKKLNHRWFWTAGVFARPTRLHSVDCRWFQFRSKSPIGIPNLLDLR